MTQFTSVWLGPNFVEPRVQLALNDLCIGGGVAFDVGANFGYLSVLMSRQVGPRGVVCSFEANPNIAQLCQDRLISSGCSNTQLYNTAIYSKSRDVIKLYLSENMVSDSIHNRVSENTVDVQTISLDDFVEKVGLVPDIIKMDIEGAELDALMGFQRTLAQHKPTMILEQTPQDSRCLDHLVELGYVAIDLGTYTRLNSMSEVSSATPVTDVLFMTPEKLALTPYSDLTVSTYGVIDPASFTLVDGVFRSAPMRLPTGRYIAHANFDAEGGNSMLCGVELDGVEVVRMHADANLLRVFGSMWQFNALESREVTFFFRFTADADPTFALRGFSLQHVPSFAGQSPLFS